MMLRLHKYDVNVIWHKDTSCRHPFQAISEDIRLRREFVQLAGPYCDEESSNLRTKDGGIEINKQCRHTADSTQGNHSKRFAQQTLPMSPDTHLILELQR